MSLLLKAGAPSQVPIQNFYLEKKLKIVLQMFNWLVGETEVWSTDVVGPDGLMREQRSVLHIKKCRFLEAVSML